ncbi:MAG: AAA family ATPase [Bacteroidales bacterium]|nr:AAA family ATPase [Bacteroidales bacterium]MDD4670737.1 AAA family ATPase [Bacteroidales bacterium]
MEDLIKIYIRLLRETEEKALRYLYPNVDWNERCIAIIGAKGVGKTTMLLQHIKATFENHNEALYASLDNTWFANHTISDLADEFYINGGTHLFLDEIHHYPNWAKEIKNIYDSFPKLNIVFTGSSLLQIYKSTTDLSRRVVYEQLEGLSFREFLKFENIADFPLYSLRDIVENHQEIAFNITEHIKIIPLFKKYLKSGYYLFYKQGLKKYDYKLQEAINNVIDVDIPAIENIEFASRYKLKKLLAVLSEMVPYTPNIVELSRAIDTSRNDTVKYLSLLESAKLLNLISYKDKTIGNLTKPDKVLLNNTNISYLFGNTANIGSTRETVFVNQVSAVADVYLARQGDFIVEEYTFEVGGKSKSFDQIKDIPNSFVVADDIEVGYKNRIPLWLFGMLY